MTDATKCNAIEKELLSLCDYVRITWDASKKRPWRVEVWKCKRCRKLFVADTKLEALQHALDEVVQ